MSSHIINGKMTWDVYRKCACGGPIMRKDNRVKLCLGCLRERHLMKLSSSNMPWGGHDPVPGREDGWE